MDEYGPESHPVGSVGMAAGEQNLFMLGRSYPASPRDWHRGVSRMMTTSVTIVVLRLSTIAYSVMRTQHWRESATFEATTLQDEAGCSISGPQRNPRCTLGPGACTGNHVQPERRTLPTISVSRSCPFGFIRHSSESASGFHDFHDHPDFPSRVLKLLIFCIRKL